MIKLTPEISQALQDADDQPLMLEDERTHAHYVLLPVALFDRLKALFSDDLFDANDASAAQSAVAGPAGWDDAEMSVYDAHHANKPAS